MENSAADQEKSDGIRRVRRVATGILSVLACIFFGSFLVNDPPTWLLLVRAMAEAGMVGGLADWFAVEALFRHPLRIPIPHTALLPKNQKRAAVNIARFIDEYFLVPDQLLGRLAKLNPVRRAAEWLSQRHHAESVGRELSGLLRLILKSQLRGGIGKKGTAAIKDLLVTSVSPSDLARNLSGLLKEATHGTVLNEILQEVRNVVDQNRGKVTELVQEHSRWWIASTVDKQIVRLLVDGILATLDELADDSTELRGEFNHSIEKFLDEFHTSGKIEGYIERGKLNFVESAEFEDALKSVLDTILARIESDFDDRPENMVGLLSEAVSEFAQMLLDQPELECQLERRLNAGLETLLDEVRPGVVSYISDVISDWNSSELVERIELEVGRDLQFIRINGAVLGALVGGTLFLVTRFAH